ncbi:MAG: hypothetical protein ACHQSE_00300 [Gemmatimonadales bacterium]
MPSTGVPGEHSGGGRRRKSGPLSVLAAAIFVTAVSCGDPYLHTNPYDPAYPVEFVITGPDSLFSYGEIAHYSVQTVPAFPDTAFRWDIDTVTVVNPRDGVDSIVDGHTVFNPSGPGAYTSISPPLEPATVTISISASLGQVDTTVARCTPECHTIQTEQQRHTGYKSIVLTQRVTRIRLRCPDTQACDTLAVGGAWSVWVDGFDALNRQIAALTSSTANPKAGSPVVTYLTRDTTIATVAPVGIRAATVIARKSGVTWIVATRGALADSLQLVVQ